MLYLAPTGDERSWKRLEIGLQIGLMLVKHWLTPWQAHVETRVRDDLVLPYRHNPDALLETQPLAWSFRAADDIPTRSNVVTKNAKLILPPSPRPLFSYKYTLDIVTLLSLPHRHFFYPAWLLRLLATTFNPRSFPQHLIKLFQPLHPYGRSERPYITKDMVISTLESICTVQYTKSLRPEHLRSCPSECSAACIILDASSPSPSVTPCW